jgi:multidrug efflux pump
MSISSPFIARPIATSLLAFAVLLAGLYGYSKLSLSSLPQVDFPTIEVTTEYPGASAETMSHVITDSLERQFGQIAGLSAMSSISAEGTSQITLQFALTRNIDDASEDVQAAITSAQGTMPSSLPYPPTYSKVNPADTPMISLALTSDTLPLDKVADAADTLLQPKLSQISGVGRVTIMGNLKAAIRVQIDPVRLASYNMSMEDVRTAIAAANTTSATGSFEGKRQAITISTNDQLVTSDQYPDLVLAWRNGAPVRMRDVGTVLDDVANTRVGGWYNGQPAVLLDVQRQPGQNIVETVARLRAALPALQRSLPYGIKLTVLNDRTDMIRASVRDVEFTLALATGLVVMVIFLFLRSLRATIIPAVALPLSLIGTFAIMAACGYSLDNLSLMALTIATGFVVDDAIVMIENIVRLMEQGVPPLTAAFRGAKQIGFTIVSLTVSLVAVFIPLLFMTGVVGRLFQEFSVTLAVSVVVSAVVSLTLTPMMCGRILRPVEEERPGKIARLFERGFDWSLNLYARTLEWSFGHQGKMLIVAGATLVGTIGLYLYIPKGFLPLQDTGMIAVVTEAAQDVSIPHMKELQQQLAAVAQADPAVVNVVSFVGVGTVNATPNVGRLTITLKPLGQRPGVTVVAARLQNAMAVVPGMKVFMRPVQDIQISTRVSRTQFQYTLTDTNSAELNQWAPKLVAALAALPELKDVATDQQTQGLGTYVNIDRAAAKRLGVSMQSIDDILYDAYGQRQVSTIYASDNQYQVVMAAGPKWSSGPDALSLLRIPSSNAGAASNIASATETCSAQIPLGQIATIEQANVPLTVNHLDQFPAITLSFNVADGSSLGSAIKAVTKAEQNLGMPITIVGSYAGDAAEFEKSLVSEPWLIMAAVVVIYIVLGVLYESLIHPITIISTLPSAGIGALLALLVTGNDLSLVALVGIVLLMGIVKKNAIMMIDFAIDAQRHEGLNPLDAIRQACLQRYRPIMMTTAAAMLGAVPLVAEQGAGSELRMPLGITIIGGLVLSQLITLYTTPSIYLAFERLTARLQVRRAQPALAE